ncbi:MAG TPA: hypothetical protein PKD86_02010 [Gemmatales bacterium]|nr:hypothetical protein [Gemmatales bacterium]HMP58103.1 hypothetical protein [Gemmatales bacterium]
MPKLLAPSEEVFAEAWAGRRLPVRWIVENAGSGELVLDNIRVSCACASLFRMTPKGILEPVASLRLPAGGKQELHWPITVQGKSGDQPVFRVFFRTNDPQLPEGSFTAKVERVRGDVSIRPTKLNYGAILVGSTRKQNVQLVVDKEYPYEIRQVLAGEGWCQVAQVTKDKRPDGDEVVIAEYEVSVTPDTPGPLETELLVHTTDGEVRKFPVSVVAQAHVECRPKSLVFPRYLGRQLSWEQEARLDSLAGGDVEIISVEAPAGVEVEVLQEAGTRKLRIALQEQARGKGEQFIHGSARADGKESPFRIRIFSRGEP